MKGPSRGGALVILVILCYATRFAECFSVDIRKYVIPSSSHRGITRRSSNIPRSSRTQHRARPGRLCTTTVLSLCKDDSSRHHRLGLLLIAGCASFLLGVSAPATALTGNDITHFRSHAIAYEQQQHQQIVMTMQQQQPILSSLPSLANGNMNMFLASAAPPTTATDDYQARAELLGFADKKDVKDAIFGTKDSIVLDVRTQKEMTEKGTLREVVAVEGNRWVSSECTTASCPELEGSSGRSSSRNRLLGKEAKKDQTIVVYCASGKRAAKAKQVLEAQGYTHVLNAGGLKDLNYLIQK